MHALYGTDQILDSLPMRPAGRANPLDAHRLARLGGVEANVPQPAAPLLKQLGVRFAGVQLQPPEQFLVAEGSIRQGRDLSPEQPKVGRGARRPGGVN